MFWWKKILYARKAYFMRENNILGANEAEVDQWAFSTCMTIKEYNSIILNLYV